MDLSVDYESPEIRSALTSHMKAQVQSLNDSFPFLRGLHWQRDGADNGSGTPRDA